MIPNLESQYLHLFPADALNDLALVEKKYQRSEAISRALRLVIGDWRSGEFYPQSESDKDEQV
jgi:hypothetical protein